MYSPPTTRYKACPTPEKFPFRSLRADKLPSYHYSDFYHQKLVLLVLELHISGIRLHISVLFCISLLSLNICFSDSSMLWDLAALFVLFIVVCIPMHNNITIYPFYYWWSFGLFLFSSFMIKLLWTFLHKSFGEYMHLFLLGIYWGMELLGLRYRFNFCRYC